MSMGTVDPKRQCLDRIFPRDEPDEEALSLFALMTVLGYPIHIMSFVLKPNWGLDAYSKVDSGKTLEEIESIRTTHFSCLEHEEGRELAKSFIQEVFKFACPVFKHTEFTQFHDGTVLPFVETYPLGEGSFGEVFAFKLYPYYNELPDSFQSPEEGFARKEIRVKGLNHSQGHLQPHRVDFSRANFHKEVKNLILLNETLRDDHIVQIVKPYGIGNKMNIIFPRAKGNLHQFLRDESYKLADLNCMPIRKCLIWSQMEGIAKALHRILAGVKTKDGKELLGYHFDLKPANILVYGTSPTKYTFKITDFGLSWFKGTDGGSNTKPFLGDGRYMPPEAAPDRTANRRYDIWSLGCILLEATAFVVKSYEGVRKLDEACRTDTSTELQPYFERSPVDGSPAIRRKVAEFMDTDILAFVENGNVPGLKYGEKDKGLIRDMMKLIKGMLNTTAGERLTSEEVVFTLKQLHLLWDGTAKYAHKMPFTAQLPGETEIGREVLQRTERLAIKSNCESAKEPLRAFVQIFETQHDCLRIVATPVNIPNAPPSTGTGLRSDILLVPQYAMDKEYIPGRSDVIRLIWASNPKANVSPFDFTHTGDLNELRELQSVLLGQKVHYSIPLSAVEIKTPFAVRPLLKSLVNKTLGSLQTNVNSTDSTSSTKKSEKGPYTIQLWREEDPETSTSKSDWIGHPCHFVIYYASEIVIIPFKKTLRSTKLEKQDLANPNLVDLEIIPMQAHMHRRFDMVVLKAATDNDGLPDGEFIPPAFPLCKKKFKIMMKTDGLNRTFESIKLTFNHHQGTFNSTAEDPALTSSRLD
ncbi:hypothetical protein IFR05_008369 [Cadophora sp. M221]|nr:hypothetical protein IFR05_008369 [Cadophora sp. M221]